MPDGDGRTSVGLGGCRTLDSGRRAVKQLLAAVAIRRSSDWPARCDGRAETGPPGNLRSRHREEDMTRKMSSRTRDVVQVKNPRSGHYVKIDRGAGKIVSHKKSPGPYKGVPVARKKKSR